MACQICTTTVFIHRPDFATSKTDFRLCITYKLVFFEEIYNLKYSLRSNRYKLVVQNLLIICEFCK